MSDTKSQVVSESSFLGTKRRDSLEEKVIEIPIIDGKTDTENSINTTALAYILRVRGRLDRENQTGAASR